MDKKQIFRAVMHAIKSGDCEKVRQVFESKPEAVTMQSPLGTWLHSAARSGQLEIVRLLVEYFKMDVNEGNKYSDRKPLDAAAFAGVYDIAKYLLDRGAEFDTDGPESIGNPLFGSILGGNVEIAKLLIDRGIDTKVQYGSNGLTAADFARSRGASEFVEVITGKKEQRVPNPPAMPPRELSYDSLLDVAIAEGVTAFGRAIESNPNETFYAFGFYTDNSVSGVSPVANTVEAMHRNDGFADDELYFRWAPEEWNIPIGSRGTSNLMAETNKLISRMSEANPQESTEEFIARKKATLTVLNQALLNIRETGIFRNCAKKKKIAFWCHIGEAEGREIQGMLEPALVYMDPEDRDAIKDLFEMES